MNKTDTTVSINLITPIGDTCHRRACRAKQAKHQSVVGGAGNSLVFIAEPEKVEQQGSAPGTDGNICQHGVNRVAKPRAVQHIFDLAPRLTWLSIELQQPVLKWSRQRVHPGLLLNQFSNCMSQWWVDRRRLRPAMFR